MLPEAYSYEKLIFLHCVAWNLFLFASLHLTLLRNSYWCCYCSFCCSSFSTALLVTIIVIYKKNWKCIFMSPLLSSLQCMTGFFFFKKRVCTIYNTLLECCRFGLISWMILLSIAFCNCKYTQEMYISQSSEWCLTLVLGQKLNAHQNVNVIR